MQFEMAAKVASFFEQLESHKHSESTSWFYPWREPNLEPSRIPACNYQKLGAAADSRHCNYGWPLLRPVFPPHALEGQESVLQNLPSREFALVEFVHCGLRHGMYQEWF